jgi:hypothetical protein
MNEREKTYLTIIIILLMALIIKSFYLDEVRPVTEEEKMFKDYVYRLVEEKHDGLLSKSNIISYRVVSIKKIENDGVSIIEVKDGENNSYKLVEIPGKYKAKVRKYLLHFIPYGEDTVLSRK